MENEPRPGGHITVRVLVTGAGGLLGRTLLETYSGRVTGLTHAELDITDEAAVSAAVHDLVPDLVVNAAALTDVDACESDPDRAHRVNALGPWWLARACARTGATLVHVSTDYVFGGEPPVPADGGLPRGWSEFDPVLPVNVYGRTKVAGETLVRQTLPTHHIVRTSWVAGAHTDNFVTRVLQAARGGQPLTMVDDQHGCPTYVRDLAGAIRDVGASGRHGTWHRTNTGSATRYEQTLAILELAGLDVPVQRQSTAQAARPAPRPAWSVLDDRHARTCGFRPLPHWYDGLRRLLDELR